MPARATTTHPKPTSSSKPSAPSSGASASAPLQPSGQTHDREARVRCLLNIPSSLFDVYAEQAIARGIEPEALMEERLLRCLTHTATHPLYFGDDERRKLEQLVGHNCKDVGVVLAQIATAVKCQVGDVEVEIQPRLQQRIKARVFRGETYDKVVQREVTHALERFAGLRP